MSGSAARTSQTGVFVITIGAALMALGVVMVLSTSASLDNPTVPHTWASLPVSQLWRAPAFRQLSFAAGSFAVMLLAAYLPYAWWGFRQRGLWQPAVFAFLLTLACLVVVLIPGVGTEHRGVRRWLDLGLRGYGLSFQPSEMAKLAMVLFLAAWFGRVRTDPRRLLRGLGPALVVIGLCVGLVGVEDFGTAALLATVAGLILLVAGARIWHLLMLSGAGAAALAGLLYVQPYRIKRITDFLTDPWADPTGKGYQAVQSLCAIGSGGWFGKGLGAGMQKYGYLPESRTDFIFGIICEELGLIGGLLVIALFLALMWNGRQAMAGAADTFGRLLAFGVTVTIGLQAAMNVAVATVSVPTKGIALPLVSSGGSGMLFLAASLGLLASVARYGPRAGGGAGTRDGRFRPAQRSARPARPATAASRPT